jgi:hypothetical protein
LSICTVQLAGVATGMAAGHNMHIWFITRPHAATLVEGITGWHERNPLALLHEILSRKRIVALLARYAFEVTRIFESEPLFVTAAEAS